MEDASLLVSEKFVSLQGEGVSVGLPAAFLRLARCNLSCTWCDTPYSWDFERHAFEQEVQKESLESLVTWALREAPGRLIVTGGEPLVQQKVLAEWLTLLRARAGDALVVELETNATITPSETLAPLIDQYNVSPKLSGSRMSEAQRLRSGTLQWFADEPRAFFKFVVDDDDEVAEAEELIARFSIDRGRVSFMPQAATLERLRERRSQVAVWAQSRGVRLSDRLHLELFHGRRGT